LRFLHSHGESRLLSCELPNIISDEENTFEKLTQKNSVEHSSFKY